MKIKKNSISNTLQKKFNEHSDEEMESILKSEAYNTKDNDEKYRDLEDSSVDYSDDDDDDDNKITKNAKDLAREIGDNLKNLAK